MKYTKKKINMQKKSVKWECNGVLHVNTLPKKETIHKNSGYIGHSICHSKAKPSIFWP